MIIKNAMENVLIKKGKKNNFMQKSFTIKHAQNNKFLMFLQMQMTTKK